MIPNIGQQVLLQTKLHQPRVTADLVDRPRLEEALNDRDILVFCRSGQRACYATRVLLQNGFKARNVAGGMLSRSHLA